MRGRQARRVADARATVGGRVTPVVARRALAKMFAAAIAALEPRRLVRALVRRERARLAPVRAAARARGLVVVGAGKAAARVAAAVAHELAPLVRGGIVVVPPGYECRLERIRVRTASHPLPDARS